MRCYQTCLLPNALCQMGGLPDGTGGECPVPLAIGATLDVEEPHGDRSAESGDAYAAELAVVTNVIQLPIV